MRHALLMNVHRSDQHNLGVQYLILDEQQAVDIMAS